MENIFLDSRELTEDEFNELSGKYQLQTFNQMYNDNIKAMGLGDFRFVTRIVDDNGNVGKEESYGLATMNMKLKTVYNRKTKQWMWKNSCRSYNRLCSLWGEQKFTRDGTPLTYPHDGHEFNEDLKVVTDAFSQNPISGKNSLVDPNLISTNPYTVTSIIDSSNLNVLIPPYNRGYTKNIKVVYHWDRKSSIWNVRLGTMTGVYTNLDVHTEAIRAVLSGFEVSDEELKAYRGVSKILTFRVMFGGTISECLNKLNNFKDWKWQKSNTGLERQSAVVQDQVKLLNEFLDRYNLTTDELIRRYYAYLENEGFIDSNFALDHQKDVTVFYTESIVYILAHKWLWDAMGIRSLLKYDSFFLELPEDFDGDVNELMNQAITWAMGEYERRNLIKGHVQKKFSEGARMYLVMRDCLQNPTTFNEILKIAKENNVSPASLAKRYKIEIPQEYKDSCFQDGKKKACKTNHEKRVAVMKSLVGKKGLTGTEMSQKSQFKKKFPEEFKAIFG